MKRSAYTVFITASGRGDHLGELCEYRNKTLIPVGKKPVIAHIIEAYPKDTQFVVTLGHFGNQVKDYLQLIYPEISISFVDVAKYAGEGSSMGYSMLHAESFLQLPFVYHTSDTIVKEKIPYPTKNWIAGYCGDGSSHYTSFNVLNGKVQKILEKGVLHPDYLHIGLVGIVDYKKFWKTLRTFHDLQTYGDALSDIHVLNDLFSHGIDFKVEQISRWYDTGNSDALKQAQESLSDGFYNLDKLSESIFIHDEKKVVKFYFNQTTVKKRAERANSLKGLVPSNLQSHNNFLVYPYIKGDLYAEVANPVNFRVFLDWAKKRLWRPVKEVTDQEFQQICKRFYQEKTRSRIQQFLETRSIQDTAQIINDEKIPTVEELLSMVDFSDLAKAKQMRFHGDFILDNTIKTKKGFCLLDWREDFGGLLQAGDMYYDLAKLHHNLIINHQIISQNHFTIHDKGGNIQCDVLRKDTLVRCQEVLFTFLKENKLDSKKVKILTSLVWFSSSPLHHHPYDTFLFHFAKYTLWRTLHEA